MENDLVLMFTVFGAIIVSVIGAALYLVSKSLKGAKKSWTPAILTRLSELENMVLSRDQTKLQMALIESDKLLDKVFIKLGIKGNTMGERLKNAVKLFDRNEYNRIWDAHKARNILAHEVDKTVSTDYLVKHFESLKAVIKKLTK